MELPRMSGGQQHGGSVDVSDIVRELNELRRGRGLDAADLSSRVGPRLRRASDILKEDSSAETRRKLILKIAELCGRLPADLRLAALVALGLHEDAAGEFLDRRIAWLANHFDRDPRTASRRIRQAFQLLGEYLEDDQRRTGNRSIYAPDGWYVESLKAMVRMDLDPPQLIEDRRIVATVDELDEIVVSLSAPKDTSDAGAIAAQIVYGGEIVDSDHPSPSHARFVVRLPEPLSLGQRHEYGIQFTSYTRWWMRPYYVLTPLRHCEYFSVRIRFDPGSMPERIWRLNGLPTRAVDDFTPTDDRLTLDRIGEVTAEFHDMQQGLSYGVQWSTRNDRAEGDTIGAC